MSYYQARALEEKLIKTQMVQYQKEDNKDIKIIIKRPQSKVEGKKRMINIQTPSSVSAAAGAFNRQLSGYSRIKSGNSGSKEKTMSVKTID